MTVNRKKDIAIVGLAFRLPGEITSSENLWDVLQNSKNLITKMDESRFSFENYLHPRKSEPGKSYTFNAGLLSKIDEFDAEFFGISPREAQQMDPQQRLLLETTWAALENSRRSPDALSGSDCAVYVGISGNEYSDNWANDNANIDSYTMLGSCPSIAANRISYIFDLHGPSLSIDTACSSGLVALHQACNCLWNDEASMAIVGGVNLLLSPNAFIGFSKASMLSPEGQCKSFSEEGRGYVRAEGCVVFLLKPLEAAERDGDFIHATIRQTGVNSDGHTNGIALPSAELQAALLKRVHESAGMAPDDVDYVETHGTGTVVGDYAETLALGEALAKNRAPDNPLLIGSIKSNLGHLEPVSGLVGVLKTILCLQHNEIPPSIQSENLNPNIDFNALNLKVVRNTVVLPKKDKAAIMAVSSFGFGGTNAHVIVSQYISAPSLEETRLQSSPQCLPPLILSYHHEQVQTILAKQYLHLLQQHPDSYYDIAYALADRRLLHDNNTLIYGETLSSILETLNQLTNEKSVSKVVTAQSLGKNLPVALIYSGNGSQWQGMGVGLLKEQGIFLDTIDEIDALFLKYSDVSIKDELLASIESSRFDETEIAQPCLFALQVASTRYFLQQGLQIKATAGHSVGEIAAAWACGALTLAQAVEVVYQRSFWQGKTRGQGRMMALALGEQAAETLIAQHNFSDKVSIAAINSAQGVTLAGDLQALQQIQRTCEEKNTFNQLLDLDYAFHTSQMDSIREELLTALGDLQPQKNNIIFISTVHGEAIAGECLDGHYWWKNIREPVKFHQSINALIDQEIGLFIEVGPHPVLKFYLDEIIRQRKTRGLVIPTLNRKAIDTNELERVIYQAWLCGAAMDKTPWFPVVGKSIDLPAYPLIKTSCWLMPTNESRQLSRSPLEHPLLGRRIKVGEAVWENHLDHVLVPYLADHVVDGAVVMPAAGYAEMALSAAKLWYGHEQYDIRDIDILTPMVFDEKMSRIVRFELQTRGDGFIIKSRIRHTSDDWVVHVVGRITPNAVLQESLYQPLVVDTFKKSAHAYDGNVLYQRAQTMGLLYGKGFQGIHQYWLQEHSALAYVDFSTSDLVEYCLYPGILDACFQLLIGLLFEEQTRQQYVLLPVRMGRLMLFNAVPNISYISATLVKQSKQSILADFTIMDEHGNLIAIIKGCRFQQAYFYKPSQAINEYVCKPYLLQSFLADGSANSVNLKKIQQQVLSSCENVSDAAAKHFDVVIPVFDMVISQFVYQAIIELASGLTSFTYDEFLIAAKIVDTQQCFLQWCLRTLCEDGLLQQGPEGEYQIPEDTNIDSPSSVWNMLLAHYPEYQTELLLVGRVGLQLPLLLQGKVQALDVLYSQRKNHALHHFFEESASVKGIYPLIHNALHEIVAAKPVAQRIRILDVGYGIGSLSTDLIHSLPSNRMDYQLVVVDDTGQFAVESDVFVNVMTMTSTSRFLEKETLSGQSFDLIIIRHYAHEWEDIEHALAQLKERLSTDGVLIVVEQHSERLQEFILGSQSDWWYENKQGQSQSRFYSAKSWVQRLERAGFQVGEPVLEPGAQKQEGAYLLLAKAAIVSEDASKSREPASDELPAIEGENYLMINEINEPGNALYAMLQEKFQHTDALFDQIIIPATLLDEAEQIEYFQQLLQPFVARQQQLRIIWLFADVITLEQGVLASTSLIHMIKAIQNLNWRIAPQLTMVTHEGCPEAHSIAGSDGPSLKAHQIGGSTITLNAILCGFARVLMNEYEQVSCKLIDLLGTLDEQLIRQLYCEIIQHDQEKEIILTASARFGLRVELAEQKHQAALPIDDYHLDFKRGGSLNNLRWMPSVRPALAADDVMVRPYACGLNFRDVMYAMGLLPDEAVEHGFLGASLGMEFSGEVLAIGEKVTQFQVGDQVMGFAPSSFSTMTVTKASVITPLPQGWSHAIAATVPIAFFTAYYAIHYLARLQPGERILIHGAAGGVGLAAIQVAKHIGAEIYTTAGSDEKRDFLQLMGITNCYDSRSLLFADRILADTAGDGIDVVLNCLAGDAIDANLEILKPFGRFLELGKRDFFANSKIGLRPFRNNVSYFGIDADQLLIRNPLLCSQLFKDIMGLFEQSIYMPLTYHEFDANAVGESFRMMQQSRHIGKIVVNLREKPQKNLETLSDTSWSVSSDACYIVTGGCNGFGLQTAKWLIDRGARHLVLASRNGATTDEAIQTLSRFEQQGVEVIVRKLDISDAAAVEAMVNASHTSSKPLKGIIHAAAVYEDSLIFNLTASAMHNVLAPKIQGALNLHHSTSGLALDFFVVYSSVTTLFGNPGQANYVAANTCLEKLITDRHALGLPGLFVAWGPIEDAGYLSRNSKLKQSLSEKMGQLLRTDDALEHLEKMMRSPDAGRYVAHLNLSKMQRHIPVIRSPKFSALLAYETRFSKSFQEPSNEIRALIAEKTHEEVLLLVNQMLTNEIAHILRMPVDKIEVNVSLLELGMDSMVGAELSHAITERFAIQIPMFSLAQGISIEAISERIITQLRAEDEAVEMDADILLASAFEEEASRHGERLSKDMILDIMHEGEKAMSIAE